MRRRGCRMSGVLLLNLSTYLFFFFQAEDGIRDLTVTGVQTCALPICLSASTIGIQDSLWSAPGLLALWTAEYTRVVGWEVEYTDEFGAWWAGLSEAQQDRIAATVRLLAARGPSLPFPHSSAVNGSRHQHMREL